MMMSLFSAVTGFIASHPHLAYAAVFLLALSEAIPVIGTVVPGSTVILAISALVPSGVVTLWPLLIAAAAGAIIGDGLSFWFGHRYQREILSRWPLNRYPDLIARGEAFFSRYGDKSVFLGRFIPPVRAFIPLIAGMLRMPVRRFYAANIASALAWAPSHILPGVLVGAWLGLLGAAAKPLAALLIILLVALWAVTYAVRYALQRGIPLLMAGSERLRTWASTRDTWSSRILRSFLDPSQHEAKALAGLAVVLIGATWLFFGVLEDIVSGDPLVRTDATIYRIFQDLRTPLGDSAMIAITELGDAAVVLPITIIVFLWLSWQRAWRTAAYWLAAIGGASILNTGIKAALHRARPGELLYSGWSAFSFPSGHSTVNVVLYGFLAFLIARQVRPAWHLPVALGAASLTLLIAFSRLYLGAHWFSDVIGGLAFGTAWLALLGLSYLYHQSERREARGLLVVGCAALVLAGGFNVYRRHAMDIGQYAVPSTVPTMVAADWWTTDWQRLSAQRVDLEGEMEEPLTIQWAGSLQGLQDALLRKGWRPSVPWTPSSTLAWLTAKADPAALPVVPFLAGGRLPSLTLVHPHGDAVPAGSRLVLRMWAVDIELTNGRAEPLWIGSVVEERLDRPLALFTVAWTQPDMNMPREVLAAALDGARLVTRAGGIVEPGWDGRVLLARERAAPMSAYQ